ncbi:MACPF domain-containing protein [Vigna angularis]|uniref:MACPF domain-containing protein n=1 Tax=Phaseolus angularis TaxID=3914 RepID=A0A8T0LFF6_PHAAN|nr:MACPF domain-containing protein [Vigna angularis]
MMGMINVSIAGLDPQMAAEKAVKVIGQGYDLCRDIRFSVCKSKLIEIDSTHTRDLVFPGGVVVEDVPNSIKCDKGERTRFHSDVLPFNQMSEHFNKQLSLSGKIPSGLFNAMFNMKKCWATDAASTKNLVYDGWFITLYNVELDRTNITLSENVKKEVPCSWNPAALAEFIEKYGTHVIVGVQMGGKDVVHIKQTKNSDLTSTEVQKLLKQLADERFSEVSKQSSNVNPADKSRKSKGNQGHRNKPNPTAGRPVVKSHSKNDDVVSISVRRGGIDNGQSYNKWLSTISKYPNVISLSFVPITSLLNSVPGNGFLSHAVDSGNRPVTGIRLYLEGKKNDHLAIHLQHLSEVPGALEISDDHGYDPVDEPDERGYYEPVKWSMFSHVHTAPVQYSSSRMDESTAIVTKAWFEVKLMGMKKVLFLRLGFSTVASATIRRSEWDGPSTTSRKSGFFSALMSTRLSKELQSAEKPTKVDINSAIYQGRPPGPARAPKMLSLVDTKEMVRGPEDQPGYWVVTGAKLCVEGGRISIKAKYSLLTILSEESLL